ncbi:hypothetical protein ACVIKO_005136 [Rhizobium ruizarguesonis]|jgi:hypothetical protein
MVRRAVVRPLDAEVVRRKPQAMPGSEIFRRTRAQVEPAAIEAEVPRRFGRNAFPSAAA